MPNCPQSSGPPQLSRDSGHGAPRATDWFPPGSKPNGYGVLGSKGVQIPAESSERPPLPLPLPVSLTLSPLSPLARLSGPKYRIARTPGGEGKGGTSLGTKKAKHCTVNAMFFYGAKIHCAFGTSLARACVRRENNASQTTYRDRSHRSNLPPHVETAPG